MSKCKCWCRCFACRWARMMAGPLGVCGLRAYREVSGKAPARIAELYAAPRDDATQSRGERPPGAPLRRARTPRCR
jgi:hypothetical protein